MKHLILNILLTAIAFQSLGQKTGNVLIYAMPKNATMKLDGKPVVSSKLYYKVTPGIHKLESWTEGAYLRTDTFTIRSDQYLIKKVMFDYRPDYLEYKKELKKYKKAVFISRTLPIMSSLIILGSSGITYMALNRRQQETLDSAIILKDKYERALTPVEIADYKYQFNKKQSSYEKTINHMNQIRTFVLIFAPVAITTSTVIYLYSRKLKKPVYNDTNPLARLDLKFYSSFNNFWYASISYKF